MQTTTLKNIKSLSRPLLARVQKRFQPTTPFIGLDIGSRLIKMVQLQQLSQEWQLVDVRIGEVLNESEGKRARNREHALKVVIKRLVEEAGIGGAKVSISISGPSVMVKPIDVPWMTEEELEGHLEWEVERYLPYEPADIYWDYYVPQRNKLSPSSSMKVYLVAAKKEIVDQRVELVKQSGLQPDVVDIDCMALANMYTWNYSDSSQEPVLLVNFGPSGLLMITAGISEVFSMRDAAPLGGDWSQEVLQEGARLAREGEIVRKESMDQTKALHLLLEEIYREVTNELRRFMDDCHSYEKDQRVHRVVLCGGYVHLPGLVDGLSSQLHMPVEIVNPFKKLTMTATAHERKAFENLSSLAGVAVGLALRCGTDQ